MIRVDDERFEALDHPICVTFEPAPTVQLADRYWSEEAEREVPWDQQQTITVCAEQA